MEQMQPPLNSEFDWLYSHRALYHRLSLSDERPPWPAQYLQNNNFCNACLNITKARKSEEFKTIRQRNLYYDFLSYVFEYEYLHIADQRLKDIKFFHATTAVTTWAALGGVESIPRDLVMSEETINILSEVNRILFKENMHVIHMLLFTSSHNFPYEFVNNNPAVLQPKLIPAFDFDLQMVRFEQNLVENYLVNNRLSITENAQKEINDILNANGIILSIAEAFDIGIARNAIDMAKDAFGSDLNFFNYRHRTAVGFASVHIFQYRKFLYKEYLKSIHYI